MKINALKQSNEKETKMDMQVWRIISMNFFSLRNASKKAGEHNHISNTFCSDYLEG